MSEPQTKFKKSSNSQFTFHPIKLNLFLNLFHNKGDLFAPQVKHNHEINMKCILPSLIYAIPGSFCLSFAFKSILIIPLSLGIYITILKIYRAKYHNFDQEKYNANSQARAEAFLRLSGIIQ